MAPGLYGLAGSSVMRPVVEVLREGTARVTKPNMAVTIARVTVNSGRAAPRTHVPVSA